MMMGLVKNLKIYLSCHPRKEKEWRGKKEKSAFQFVWSFRAGQTWAGLEDLVGLVTFYMHVMRTAFIGK